jgi:AraC family transcriptional regulator of adaptative response / DNA-3-methyladenine glycosylase II
VAAPLTFPVPPAANGATIDRRSVYARALEARDPRFDGLFFVGITSTRIYCRPVCPARVSRHEHRRFFRSAAAAERAGYRPCLRCRPELAPGLAVMDAVPRLAHVAAERIAAGALNGRSIATLAEELEVSERHLRRALERELGVSPGDLAQTCRLLLAKQLLADTRLSITQIAFASGFQSVRRFNDAFRQQYRRPPSAVRRLSLVSRAALERDGTPATDGSTPLRLTLAYRAPFEWDTLVAELRDDAIAGVELVEDRRYLRTIAIDGHSGFIRIEHPPDASTVSVSRTGAPTRGTRTAASHIAIHVSPSLTPVLMPLLARVRRLLDLDADPAAINAHLAQSGLGSIVSRRPGARILGAMDGFEVVLRALLRGRTAPVVEAFGGRAETGIPGLDRLVPSADRVAAASVDEIVALGVPRQRAEALLTIAVRIVEGRLRLDPGSSPVLIRRVLSAIPGVGDQTVTTVITRALDWPDAVSPSDRSLWRYAGVTSRRAFVARAEEWRPWRAYAALHLRLARTHVAS